MPAMRIAVLCPSEIAHRRFMPALSLVPFFEYAGVGTATPQEHLVGLNAAELSEGDIKDSRVQRERAQAFKGEFGGTIYGSYEALLADSTVEAVYVPLPPALHYPWAKRALESGKHVLLEKPFTTGLGTTNELIELAGSKCLAVHENYMFAFHSQIDWVKQTIATGVLGDVRMIRIDFGFPFRGRNDFRYSRELGGGALLDCGGYTLKLAAMLLGPSARVTASHLSQGRGLEVDLYGNATLENDEGLVAQVSFGMDNDYRCNIDVWGGEASLLSGRILTAPAGLEPTMVIRRNGEEEVITLSADDSFRKSIEHFAQCIRDMGAREMRYKEIEHQAHLVEDVVRLSHRA